MKLFYSPKTKIGESVVLVEIATLIWLAVVSLVVFVEVFL